MAKNVDTMSTQQVIKCVLVLWEQFKKDRNNQVQSTALDLNQNATKALLQQVSNRALLMNPDELTTCLLYLSKLGLDMHVPVMCHLRDIIMDSLKEGN